MKFKKLLSLFVTGLICLICIPFTTTFAEETEKIDIWDGSFDTGWYDSDETELYISTAEELAGLAKLVNSGKTMEGKIIYLEDNIYLNDITDLENWKENTSINKWTPIGYDNTCCFSGTINGNGHSILGLYINEDDPLRKSSAYIGLFGYVKNGTISGLQLEYTDISLSNYISVDVGNICGYLNSGNINNSSNLNGIINVSTIFYVGSTQKKRGLSYAGGICGSTNDSTIFQCSNQINISSTSKGADIGSTTVRSDALAGGICGYSSNTIIESCSNSGDLYASYYDENYKEYTTTYSGGICAYGNCEILSCYNAGRINSQNYSGGILSYTVKREDINTIIRNSYNVGVIETGKCKGGIIGYKYLYTEDDIDLSSTYFLSSTAVAGVGVDKGVDTTVAKNLVNMQKESFAQTLGEAFVFVEGDYPKLAWEVSETIILGDINSDGRINVTDAVIMQKYLLNLYQYIYDEWKTSDMNNDGIVNIFDMILLKRILIEQ